MVTILLTVREIFEALGGTAGVAHIAGVKYNCASNWKSFGRIPPQYYLVMIRALAERGYGANPEHWRMVEAPLRRVAPNEVRP